MNTAGHYDVVHYADGAFRHQIRWLVCQHCPTRVDVRALHRQGDKSGAGRYCRAKGKMVAHLHAEHRAALATPSNVGRAE